MLRPRPVPLAPTLVVKKVNTNWDITYMTLQVDSVGVIGSKD